MLFKKIKSLLNPDASNYYLYKDSKTLEENYKFLKSKGKKLVIGVTCGRSGSRWVGDIFSSHENATGSCERNPFEESFYRYVKWNNLQIDLSGVIEIIKCDIISDWNSSEISYITSPFLSHDLPYLFNNLLPDSVIWCVNEPMFTVNSFYNKGWYKNELVCENPELIPSIQTENKKSMHRSFARITPIKKNFPEWRKLSRVGKISWIYNRLNMNIYKDLNKMKNIDLFVMKLELSDDNYEFYLSLKDKYGLFPKLSRKEFFSIKFITKDRKKDILDSNVENHWNEKDKKEFIEMTSEFNSIYKSI